ncbi:hypothetical protein GCM10010430_18200 [Kitasatospora cystarginea]|uniref:Uncharacterized protein n=1 Tax=Kitasatospora cystarginea TaxID=58350 RepID=A0ABN3DNT6_9ACTN
MLGGTEFGLAFVQRLRLRGTGRRGTDRRDTSFRRSLARWSVLLFSHRCPSASPDGLSAAETIPANLRVWSIPAGCGGLMGFGALAGGKCPVISNT